MTMPKGWPDPDGKRAREREEQARWELRERHEYNERLFDEVKKRQQSYTKKRGEDNLAFAFLIGLPIAAFVFLLVGILPPINFTSLIIGGILFIVWSALLGIGQAETGHASYYFTWGASRGRIWRMSAAHRAIRR